MGEIRGNRSKSSKTKRQAVQRQGKTLKVRKLNGQLENA
jgi:hypothetical protein